MMKSKSILIGLAIVAVAAMLWMFRSYRGGALPGATGSVEGRAPSRPSEGSTSPESRPRQSVALQPAMEEPEGPITATAQITRGDGSVVETKSLDGEFARILVEPNEVLQIRLSAAHFDPNREVRIEADHGGSLNRRLGPLTQISKRGEDIEFQYAVGGHTGRYTLIISQGHRQELLEFRVGPEPPTGKPGPVRVFNPDLPTKERI